MELLVPFMLFIIYQGEGGLELTRHPVVYRDEQACQQAGTDMVLAQYGVADPPAFRCLPIPSNEEFDVLMQQIESDHVARRDAREAERQQPEPRPEL